MTVKKGIGSRKKTNSQLHVREIADSMTAYYVGPLYWNNILLSFVSFR